jgi:hypothetical protein
MTREDSDESERLLSMEANSKKIEERWVVIRIPSTGLRHFTGISSSYSTQYPPILQGVIPANELLEIVTRLNETIRDYWPCDTCYYFGYGCMLCTVGLSVLIPHYCATHSEKYATAVLRSYSLKARYYDRKIRFQLVKRCCHSFVEIRIPAQFFNTELLAKHHNDPLLSVRRTTAITYNDEDGDGQPVDEEYERELTLSSKGVIDMMDRGNSLTASRDQIGPFSRPFVTLSAIGTDSTDVSGAGGNAATVGTTESISKKAL